jgi:hypothetical protein
MNKITTATALIGLMGAFACPVYADPIPITQQVGWPCTPRPELATERSYFPIQGAMECIPDENGNFYWQALGGGTARYDITSTCSVAGTLRWNGAAIQYCDGSNWQSLGGTTLVVGGCQTYWSACPAGYNATSYFSPGTYNCCDRCSNPAWRYTVCSQ